MQQNPTTPSLDEARAAFPEFLPLEPLGPSGQKVTFRARDRGAEVVLKIPKKPLSQDLSDEELQELEAVLDARVMRDIETMRRVDSPHVARILRGPESREVGGRRYAWYTEPFYARCLSAISFPLALTDAITLLRGLLNGAEALAGAGIVHRDIKPANIGVETEFRAVLLDFGASLFVDDATVTSSGEVAPHTRQYSAPEQWTPRTDAGEIDFRTDLFCVGLVGYEVIVNSRPFGPANDWPAYSKRVRDQTYDRDGLLKASNDAMVAFIDRLLRPSPSARFRTFDLARAALERCS